MELSYLNKRKYKSSDLDVRMAIWKVYNGKDYYKSEPIKFREMEIDHIIPKDYFKEINSQKLKKLLYDLGLSSDFQCDDLLNYVPTTRASNIQKTNEISFPRISVAIDQAKEKHDSIIEEINKFNSQNDAFEIATCLAKYIEKSSEEWENYINVVLNEVYDFEESESINENFLSISKTRVWLNGKLPSINDLNLSCSLEFRSVKIRDVVFTLQGNNVFELFNGIHTKLNNDANNHRSFINFKDRSGLYSISIGYDRILLTKNETQQLCDVIDKYYDYVFSKIYSIENKFDLKNFIIAKEGIVLFDSTYEFYYELYNNIKNIFSFKDYTLRINGNEISIVQGNDIRAIIKVKQKLNNFTLFMPRVVYILKGNYVENDISSDGFWTPTETIIWFKKIFFPLYRTKFNTNNLLNAKDEISYYSDDTINLDSVKNIDDFIIVINKLQLFYSEINNCFLDCSNIYQGLLLLVENAFLNKENVAYICSTLKLKNTDKITNELNAEFYIHLNYELSTREIDYILRCYIEILNKCEIRINYSKVKLLCDHLKDIVEYYNSQKLLKKYKMIY